MKSSNRINIGVLISFIFLQLLIVGCTSKKTKSEKETIKIGAILPLTGEYALYGENDKKGIDLALSNMPDSINIEIIYEDNKGTAKDAVAALRRVKQQGVVAIIDDAISTITLSMVPIAEETKIPIVSTGATNPKLSGISPYFFRVWNSDTEEGRYAAQIAISEFNTQNAAIVFINSDYGLGLKNVFEKHYSENGGIVIQTIPYDEKANDFRDILSTLKFDKIDIIYLVGYAPQTGLLVKNLKELKYDKLILSTVTTEDPQFVELGGKAANGVYYVYNSTVNNSTYQAFKNDFLKMYKEDPQILTHEGFDACIILYNAILKGANTGDEIADYLKNMPEYEGASGLIKFDENGDVHKPMVIKMVKNGKFEEYK